MAIIFLFIKAQQNRRDACKAHVVGFKDFILEKEERRVAELNHAKDQEDKARKLQKEKNRLAQEAAVAKARKAKAAASAAAGAAATDATTSPSKQ